MHRLLFVGPVFLDVRVPEGGHRLTAGFEVRVPEIRLVPGGFAIAAMAARRLGADATLAAPFAPTAEGRLVARAVRAAGVAVIQAKVPSQPITVALGFGEERGFLSAAPPLDDALLAALRRAVRRGPYAAVHVSGSSPWAERARPLIVRAAPFRSLDAATDPERLASPAFRALLASVDLYLPNAREAALVSGEADPARAAAALRALVPRVVVKLGAEGALYAGPEGTFHAPAPKARAVDTTGAGDAFAAAFLLALVDGRGPAEALAFANGVAARAVAAGGPAPPAQEVTPP
jgi:ribokinase